MLLLIIFPLGRLMTGAGWNDILNPLLIQPPDCDITYKNLPYGNCGNPTLATLYLVSFIVLSSMIVINMYIAVLLENFNQAHREEELGLGEEDLERFYAKWSRYPEMQMFLKFTLPSIRQPSEFPGFAGGIHYLIPRQPSVFGIDPPCQIPLITI